MELLERASQLKALESALNQCKTGQGCIALVYGEAGIGKTSLVELFIQENRKSWRILSGACDSLFTPRPLGPLYDIAVQIPGDLLDLLNSESPPSTIFTACLLELQKPATIMVIEDVHWADEATLDWLKYLARRIHQTKTMLILTYRDDELGMDHPLRIIFGDLATSHSVYRVPVLSLSQSAVQQLAKNSEVDELELHRLTNGNPFYVTEVLAVEGGIPETVRDAVLARASRLTPSARGVLNAAAVIGFHVETEFLAKIIGDEMTHLAECLNNGMLQSDGDYLVFRHEIARQAIIESIPQPNKVDLYRITLKVLEKSPKLHQDPARLADFAAGAKDPEYILQYSPLAGHHASTLGAHHQAIAHYKMALQYADRLEVERRAELMDAYADECSLIGEESDAKIIQQEALKLWHAAGVYEKEGRALRRLAEICFEQGLADEMTNYISQAITLLESLQPAKELAMAYSHKSRQHVAAEQYAEAIYWGTRAKELAAVHGDLETMAHVLTNLGVEEMRFGRRAEGQALLEQGLQLSLSNNFLFHTVRAYACLAYGFRYVFDYPAFFKYINEGIAYCLEHNLDIWRVRLLGLRAHVQVEIGHWEEAEKDLGVASSLLDFFEEEVSCATMWLQIRRGGSLSSEVHQAAQALAHRTSLFWFSCLYASHMAEAAWLRGDLATCRAEAEQVYNLAKGLNTRVERSQLAFWLWRAGVIKTPPEDVIEPYRAQMSGDWQRAAELWEQVGCPYEQGMALMDGNNDAQMAALTIFERLGARPITEILKQKMRDKGIRIPRGPRPTTRENPFGLTLRELEVLACLAKGLSNNSIASQLNLSTRTIEHHISTILQKMDVHSRNEAVLKALKEQILPG